ncbi:uncharacterized protein METZ01_LOCUS148662 [marine metagenome]|uniref:Uncharacterized protein n=1 Tax=marine metagenome TaxID=408172 RepID=A0A382A2N9_9ZZZZ|tara:strand:+ start:44 stop:523 length:480 start_codon:yes stop_codon:yes gene_type:complete
MTLSLTQQEKQAFTAKQLAKNPKVTPSNQNPFYIMANGFNITDRDKLSKGTISEGSGLDNFELADKLEEMAEMVDMRCAYNGMQLTLECGKGNKLSFDRIDNKIGHRPDNLVITSKALNLWRKDDEYEAFRISNRDFMRMLINSPLGREIRAEQEGWGQ